MQSIIGLYELARFEDWNLKNRVEIGEYIINELKDVEQVQYLPPNDTDRKNAFWWCPIVVDLDKLTCDIKTIITAIGAEGIPCYGIQWPEAYKERAYTELNGFGENKFPFKSSEYTNPASADYGNAHCGNAAWLRDRTFSLFTHPVYAGKYTEMMVAAVKKVLAAYAK